MGKAGKRPIIGILEGICSGKSKVAAEFGKLGCGLIDTDRIAHDLLHKEGIKGKVFGGVLFRFRWNDDLKCSRIPVFMAANMTKLTRRP